MNEQLEVQDTEVEGIAEEIAGTIEGAYDFVLERRDIALAAAFKPLDAEERALRIEYGDIEEARVNLERLLPAKAREAARQADVLTVAGDHEAAQAKLCEAREAADAPKKMTERQLEISARIEVIEELRKDAARGIFETWHADLLLVARAVEHGHFIDVLDRARAEMYAYEQRHGLQRTTKKPALVRLRHLLDLTSPERSEEWDAGTRWYRNGR
jgi:hypothetical protein